MDDEGRAFKKVCGRCVNPMAELLGRNTIDKLASELPQEEKTKEEKFLEGPMMAAWAISQDDIGALLN